MSQFRRLVSEIHRRSLWQVLGVYAVASWVIYQIVLGLYEGIGLPSWVPGTALVLLLIGLPIVLATAFVQEGAPTFRGEGRAKVEGLESTAEVLARTPIALQEATAGEPASPRGRSARGARRSLLTWPRAITGGVLAFAALGLGTTGFMGMRALGIGPAATLMSAGALAAREPVVLAAFASPSGDSILARVVTEAFRADLSQSDVLTLASADELAFVLARMDRPANAELDAATAREVAIRAGMKAVIAGEVGAVGAGYVLTARVVGAEDGAILASFRETAADSTVLITAIDRLSGSLRSKAGESLRSVRKSPPLSAITTASLPALRKLLQAFDAEDRGDSDRARALLGEAIALDSGFSAAYRKRGIMFGNAGQRAQAVADLRAALERPERLTEYERYLAQASYATTVGDFHGAVETYRAMLEAFPGDATALNNMALRYWGLGEFERAFEAYEQSVEAFERLPPEASVFGPAYPNFALLQWLAGQRDDARATLELLRARMPEHPSLAYKDAEIDVALGDYAAAEHRLRVSIATRSGGTLAGHHVRLGALAALRGRTAEAARELDEAEAVHARRGYPDDALETAANAALIQAQVRMDRRPALLTLAAARARYPLEKMAAENVPDLALARAYATAGLPDSARVMLDRARLLPDWLLRREPWVIPTMEGSLALAEARFDGAALHFGDARRARAGCPTCFLPELALAHEGAGRPDSAIAAFEGYLQPDFLLRGLNFLADPLWLPLVLERLGALHEARGDPEAAARYLARFVELWQDADPELQSRVDAARRALARLSAEGGG